MFLCACAANEKWDEQRMILMGDLYTTFGGGGGGGGGGGWHIKYSHAIGQKVHQPSSSTGRCAHEYCVSWHSAMGSIMIGEECITFVWYDIFCPM